MSVGKFFKKTVVFFLVTILAISLAACGGGQNVPGTSQDSGSGRDVNSGSSEIAQPEYIIKYISGSSPSAITKSTDTKIGKLIKEKFNIVFEFEPYTGNWDEKCAIMLAAGDYPEMMNITTENLIKKYINAKALVQLDGLMEQYGRNFEERYKDTIPLWRMTSDDGSLYKYEFGAPNMECVTGSQFDISIRSDALEALGYPELLSEDSYIDFLKRAMELMPETNGQKTLGMVCPGAEPWGIQGIVPIMYEKARYTAAAGNRSVIWDNENNKFVDFMEHPYVKDSLKFFNKLYRNGLLDPESFTDYGQQVIDKISTGRPLAVWYTAWYTDSPNKQFIKDGKENMQYVVMPIMTNTQVKNKDKRVIRILDNYTWASMVITKNARQPERIMQLLDWAATEEGQVLLGWGIEGEHYNVVDGKRILTDTFKKNYLETPDYLVKEGIGTFNFLALSQGFDKNEQVYSAQHDVSVRSLLMTDRQKAVYQKYGWETIIDPWTKNKNFEYTTMHTGLVQTSVIAPDSAEGKLEEKLVEYRVKNSAPLMMAKSDEEFEALYLKAVEGYKALNGETVISKYNEVYQENAKRYDDLKAK